MALVTCAECKAEISSEANSCPQCGAKPAKKTSLLTWIVGAIFLVVVFQSCSDINEKTGGNREDRAASTTPAVVAPPTWSYSTENDEMTSKPTAFANLKSDNSLSLERPYSGENYGRLIIRKKSGKSEEVMLSFDQGQSMCRSYSRDCTVTVRFDDAPPATFSGQTPSDGSSTTVFLTPTAKFIAAGKKAKSIKVSLEIYKAGMQIYQFSPAAPLAWP